MQFLNAMIWSVGAVLVADSQPLFSNYLRDFIKHVHDNQGKTFKIEASCMIPEVAGSLANDFYVDGLRWVAWKERLTTVEADEQSSFMNMMVETTESLKTKALLQTSADCRLPVLLIGPSGTGKTAVIRAFLMAQSRAKHISVEMTFSARTAAGQLAESITR